ncbi:hypothetical protein B0H16DRAFT_1468586 [Mycena metata]|uniref:Uncharacterized protein n=1 Tax=Mycena metata TaxID=1033252 RepID=A0AAD7I1G4_9AGAR|nr:hypothetical protein B0H16DRAFT_1468586 [Mycena metata]
MAAGRLCSNHVTYRFGKGMIPKAHCLSCEAMAVIMERYASLLQFNTNHLLPSQLADQYVVTGKSPYQIFSNDYIARGAKKRDVSTRLIPGLLRLSIARSPLECLA